jgi:hypothetical protein
VGSMTALSTKLAGNLGALGKGAVWVAAWLAAVGVGVCSTMGGMTTLGA